MEQQRYIDEYDKARKDYEAERKRNLPYQTMPLGKHYGIHLKDVPLSYMEWLSKQACVVDYEDLMEYLGDLMKAGEIPWQE